MDLDNFDFKPMTDGLGFNKNSSKISSPRNESNHSPTFEVEERVEPKVKTNTQNPDLLESLITAPSIKKRPNQEASLEDSLFEKPANWDGTEVNQNASRSISSLMDSLPPSLDFVNETDTKLLTDKRPFASKKVYPAIDQKKAMAESTEIDIADEANTSDEMRLKKAESHLDISLDNTLEKAFPQEGFRRPFFQQAVDIKPQYTKVSSSFTSGFLDALVVSGLACLFTVGLVVLTGADIKQLIFSSLTSFEACATVASIFLGVYVMYFLAARGLWGATLGDWSFDIQLGMREQQKRWFYPFQVVMRTFVIAATGFIVLPLLSAIFKTDLAHGFCGLSLYIKNYE